MALGSSIDEVTALLGPPKWRLAGSSERWIYSLTSSGSAKVIFEGVRVTSVTLP